MDSAACQTCHIPELAKEMPTKLAWDWSTAGKLDETGEPFHEEDDFGNHTYLSIKGSFKWERDVTPEYVWFNGTADHFADPAVGLSGAGYSGHPISLLRTFRQILEP